ncbi:hypothetical protein K504DRAFT_467212 [Pleomassaria siparia CBS 279.74]|uniref:Uncharacterized protein n=1 Tax=Pleomassaria siparia CBS 279.74 TaxID=1314801 RepID=A0A6G1K8V0_9PLEO|nr:hypothetical protein K504DRAFT_467212 [Pleomassaria siparia CBS 279.74]
MIDKRYFEDERFYSWGLSLCTVGWVAAGGVRIVVVSVHCTSYIVLEGRGNNVLNWIL